MRLRLLYFFDTKTLTQNTITSTGYTNAFALIFCTKTQSHNKYTDTDTAYKKYVCSCFTFLTQKHKQNSITSTGYTNVLSRF